MHSRSWVVVVTEVEVRVAEVVVVVAVVEVVPVVVNTVNPDKSHPLGTPVLNSTQDAS